MADLSKASVAAATASQGGSSGGTKTMAQKIVDIIHNVTGAGDDMTQTIFQRHQAATDAKIDADSRGEDGNAAFAKVMGPAGSN